MSISRDLDMSQFWQKRHPRFAPRRPEGEDAGPGQEVVQRLLLDRIDAEPARAAMGGEHDAVAFAGADETEPRCPSCKAQ